MLDPEDYTFIVIFTEGEYVLNCRRVERVGNLLRYHTVPVKVPRYLVLTGYKIVHCDLGVIGEGPIDLPPLDPGMELTLVFPVEINLDTGR